MGFAKVLLKDSKTVDWLNRWPYSAKNHSKTVYVLVLGPGSAPIVAEHVVAPQKFPFLAALIAPS